MGYKSVNFTVVLPSPPQSCSMVSKSTDSAKFLIRNKLAAWDSY